MVLDVNGPRRVPHPTKNERAPHDLAGAAATVDARHAVKVERSLAIAATPERLYAFWRDFDNLPRFMKYIQSVRTLDEHRSHWVVAVPGGKRIEWDSEVINDIPNELIAWKTVGDSDVAHAGSVHFDAAPGGTVVRLVMDYEPPGGRSGHLLSKALGVAADRLIDDDLERLKRLMENGDAASVRAK